MTENEEKPNAGVAHHCGCCGCCGGDIPCGVEYAVRWSRSGKCPGSINRDNTCGAIRSATKRKREKPGACHN